MAIPQIAGAAIEGSPDEEAAESPEVEKSEGKFEIKCAAKDCVHNSNGYCKVDINVSAGPNPKCETYEPQGGGSSMTGGPKPPSPPLPFMGR